MQFRCRNVNGSFYPPAMIKASQIKKVLIMNQGEVMMRSRGKRVRRRRRRRSRGLGNWFLPVSALCFLLAVCIMGFKPDASAQGDSTSLAKTAYQPNSSTQTNPDSATDTLKVIEQGASTQTDPNFFPLQLSLQSAPSRIPVPHRQRPAAAPKPPRQTKIAGICFW